MSQSAMRAPKRRIPELDGLRGVAILAVLIFHYLMGDVIPGSITAHLQHFMSMAGGAGVDLFFVLSGFLIGGILMDARTQPGFFKVFYARRLFRIFPLYYAWVGLYIVTIALAGPIVNAHTHDGVKVTLNAGTYAHFLFLQNLSFLHFAGITGLAFAWLGPTWSLAVEEQFYVVSPLVVRVLSKRNLFRALIGIVLVAPLLRIFLIEIVHVAPASIFALMPTRADTLATGMLTAGLWREDRFRQWVSNHLRTLYGVFAVLLAGFASFWTWSPDYLGFRMQSVGYTLVALFFAVVLILAVHDSAGPIASLMRMAWLRALGVVSYCVYMIHLVVNTVCHIILLHSAPEVRTPKGIMVTIFAGVLTFGIAWLSWLCFERPLLRIGHRFKYDDDRTIDATQAQEATVSV